LHQVAAMTHEQLPLLVVVGPRRVGQAEAIDRGPMQGGQIGVVGFVAGISRLTILISGEGMDQAHVPAELAESPLHGTMIFAGAFDGDDEVSQIVLAERLADALDGGLQFALAMHHHRGRHMNGAEEIRQHELGAGLGAIDGNNAEVLRPDRLDTAGELTPRLLHQKLPATAGAGRMNRTGHDNYLRRNGDEIPIPLEGSVVRKISYFA
jgi:hypothetical protein